MEKKKAHTHTGEEGKNNNHDDDDDEKRLSCSFSRIGPNAIHRLQTSIDTNGFNSDNIQ